MAVIQTSVLNFYYGKSKGNVTDDTLLSTLLSRPALLSNLGGQRAWAAPTISRDQGLPRGHARIERQYCCDWGTVQL